VEISGTSGDPPHRGATLRVLLAAYRVNEPPERLHTTKLPPATLMIAGPIRRHATHTITGRDQPITL
jgi:hypothetical protein